MKCSNSMLHGLRIVCCAVLFLGSCLWQTATAAPINLITNGSFETPDVGSFQVYTAGPGPAGWTVGTNGGLIYDEPQDGSVAAEGDQLYVISGNGVSSSVSQTFSTIVGRTYDLHFQYAALSNGSGYTAQFEHSVAGNTTGYSFVTFGADKTTIPYTAVDTTFTASSTSTTLQFTEIASGPNYYSVFIDDVQVFLQPPPVPEPTTGFLLLAGVCLIRRRMRRNPHVIDR